MSNQDLIIYLRNIDYLTDYKITEDRKGNTKFLYFPLRNLDPYEAMLLQSKGIDIKELMTHRGLHKFYNINDSIRTGRNHPFISDQDGNDMTDCFDPSTKHVKVSNNNVYNVCKEEYFLRNCVESDTDACRWLKDRIMKIKSKHPEVYDYLLIKNKSSIPPHYSRSRMRLMGRIKRSKIISKRRSKIISKRRT
jgi:hypothetical protein